jgi:hypothetical protein
MGVIVKDSYRITFFYAKAGKGASEPVDPRKQIFIRIANPVPVNDFLILCA